MRPPFLPGVRTLRAAAAAAIVAGLALLAWLPEKSTPSVFTPNACAFHQLTGLPCALCGGTRSARALLHGDLPRALQLNALALPAVGLLVMVAIVLALEAIRGRPLANWRTVFARSRPFLPIAVLLLLLWWIPQIIGALRGPKSELLDLRNPIARTLSEKFRPQIP